MSSIYSFEMNKVNLFPDLMSPFPKKFFLSSISIADEIALVVNLDKNYIAKRTTWSNNTFLL